MALAGTPVTLVSPAARRPIGLLRWLRWIAFTAFVIGYSLLLHQLIASQRWPVLTPFAGLAPVTLLLTVAAFSAGHRVAALLVLLMVGASAWHWRVLLQASSAWIYLLEHVGAQLFLCWMFGHTLASRDGPALITRLALRVHGTLVPELILYTRRVTLAWALFFAFDAVVSLLLFAFAPLAVWSLFANLLTLPLVAVMFLGEYLVRRLSHPDVPHVSIATGVRAFWGNRTEGGQPVAPR